MTTMATHNKQVEQSCRTGATWLADMRRAAWSRYEQMSFPTGRQEHWRYTNLKQLAFEQYAAATPDEAFGSVDDLDVTIREHLGDLGASAAAQLVSCDGSSVHVTGMDALRSAGVIVSSIAEASSEHESLVREHLGQLVTGDEDVFAARSLATFRDGVFVYVPDGVAVELPLQLVQTLATANAACGLRTVVVVGRDASVTINEVCHSSDMDESTLVLPATEVYAGRNATVQWITWQDWGANVRQVGYHKARLDAHATMRTMTVSLGGSFARTWKESILAGEDSDSLMLGLYLPSGTQQFEHWTVQHHQAPRSRSDLLYKGVLADESRAVYYGTIRVDQQARNADAYQANRNLTLSPKAKVDTNPQLEIETNDVRCTHGATVGRVDESHMFYLTSRGIPRPQAKRLIVHGFFNDVLGRASWSGMSERIGDAILEKVETQL